MIRCVECGAALDSISELSTHECEKPDVKRTQELVRKAQEQEAGIDKAWNDYGGA